MSIPHRPLLENLQARVGHMLKLGNRLFAAMLILGSLFSLAAVKSQPFLKQPEQALQLQAFLFNYSEFKQVEYGLSPLQMKNFAALPKVNDPNWDGTIAGASLGMAIGRDIPMVGLVLGPALGAVIGYELDSKI